MSPNRPPSDAAPPAGRGRRADAERSVERILGAALDALVSDPEASMSDIACRAGVARATIYVHFPTREELVKAVTERAIAEVTQAMVAAEPDRDDPADALERLLKIAWHELGRFHALVSINLRQPQPDLRKLHRPVFSVLQPLIERGQRDDTFRSDVSAAWHISMLLALIHAASVELESSRLPRAKVESALVATALGSVAALPPPVSRRR